MSILIQASGNFEVTLEQDEPRAGENIADIVTSGRVEIAETIVAVGEAALTATKSNDDHHRTFNHRQIYDIFKNLGYDISDCFALIQRVDCTGEGTPLLSHVN